MRTNRWVLWVAAIVATVLAGCGGSGSDAPTVDTGSAVINSAGGTVATTSGAARAVFPANAVNANTMVTITADSQAPASSRLIKGTAYEFSPSGALAQPVSVTLRYGPARLPAGALQSRPVFCKAVNGAWVAVPNSVVDTVTCTVTASPSSFSTYAARDNNRFEGNYGGADTSATFPGTWNARINDDSSLTATATGGFTGTGRVGFAGTANISLGGSGTTPVPRSLLPARSMWWLMLYPGMGLRVPILEIPVRVQAAGSTERHGLLFPWRPYPYKPKDRDARAKP